MRGSNQNRIDDAAPRWFGRNRWLAITVATFGLAGVCLGLLVAWPAAKENHAGPRLKLERELLLAPNHSRGTVYTYRVTWSSDGTKLAAYSSGGVASSAIGDLVTVWNSDGRVFRELAGTQEWRFDPLSPLAFINGDKEIATPPPETRPELAFSVFDVGSGKVVEQIEGLQPQAPRGYAINRVTAFAVSPDQTVLAVDYGWGVAQPVGLYSTKTWQRLALVPASRDTVAERTIALAFAPNGALLGIGKGTKHVELYDRRTERILRTIDAFPEAGGLDAIAFSPDSSMVAAVSAALPLNRSGTGAMQPVLFRDRVRVFRVQDGSPAAAFPELTSPIHGLAWSARGLLAFESTDGTVRVWNPNNMPASAGSLRLRAAGVAFSPDGARLAVPVGSTIRIFRVEE